VSSLSTPLERAQIDIIYLSTFNTDLILVPEDNTDKAHQLISSATDLLEKIHHWTKPPSIQPHEVENNPQVIVKVLPNEMCIANFRSMEFVSMATFNLLHQFFFSERDSSGFFSFTSSSTEVSIIVDKNSLSNFPPDLLEIHSNTWRAIQVLGEGLQGFVNNHVSIFSRILAEVNVAIYYVSTFNNDFIFVSNDKITAAINSLQKHFTILVDE